MLFVEQPGILFNKNRRPGPPTYPVIRVIPNQHGAEQNQTQLRQIKCPVLGFWGRYDRFLPYEQNEVLREALPNARIVLSDEAGHWFMIEERDRFNAECLDFLQNA